MSPNFKKMSRLFEMLDEKERAVNQSYGFKAGAEAAYKRTQLTQADLSVTTMVDMASVFEGAAWGAKIGYQQVPGGLEDSFPVPDGKRTRPGLATKAAIDEEIQKTLNRLSAQRQPEEIIVPPALPPGPVKKRGK